MGGDGHSGNHRHLPQPPVFPPPRLARRTTPWRQPHNGRYKRGVGAPPSCAPPPPYFHFVRGRTMTPRVTSSPPLSPPPPRRGREQKKTDHHEGSKVVLTQSPCKPNNIISAEGVSVDVEGPCVAQFG